MLLSKYSLRRPLSHRLVDPLHRVLPLDLEGPRAVCCLGTFSLLVRDHPRGRRLARTSCLEMPTAPRQPEAATFLERTSLTRRRGELALAFARGGRAGVDRQHLCLA